MKYVALAYPRYKEGMPEREDVEKAEKEAKEKWENTSKEYRHPYHMIEIYMESLKKYNIPFVYLKGIEAENERNLKDFAISILMETFPAMRQEAPFFSYEAIILPYVEEIVLDPPEDNKNRSGNALLRGLAVVSALVTAITVGWLRGVWSE
jgi:hypothetical protein